MLVTEYSSAYVVFILTVQFNVDNGININNVGVLYYLIKIWINDCDII
jgi:hypothetical protein